MAKRTGSPARLPEATSTTKDIRTSTKPSHCLAIHFSFVAPVAEQGHAQRQQGKSKKKFEVIGGRSRLSAAHGTQGHLRQVIRRQVDGEVLQEFGQRFYGKPESGSEREREIDEVHCRWRGVRPGKIPDGEPQGAKRSNPGEQDADQSKRRKQVNVDAAEN